VKTCPRCTGQNPSNARICEYCGKPFAPPAPRKKQDWGAILLVVVVVGLCLGVAFLFNNNDAPSMTTSESAWFTCREFISDRLKAPSTAKFERYNSSKVVKYDYDEWKVTMYVDAENSFGAMMRNDFYCHLQDRGDEWYLISIDETN